MDDRLHRLTRTLPPALYWRFRAASLELHLVEAQCRARLQAVREAHAVALDAIVETDPTFDRTLNYQADDTTCTLTAVSAQEDR